ncbi:FosX/FosE/FosI family fosfomycin resistance hydrolase [Rhizobium helianthi]|uniref:FosX/FosE/FosI family fosfomycin resistance hydrolase n=1 Tax=Rhizobium helianthi TaxID=1132695 RepID=A0ABW4M2L4_9HYPH
MLSHITFVVRNLDCMERIVLEVLKGRRIYASGPHGFSLSPERFYLIGEGDCAVWMVAMQGEPLAQRSYNHVAFKIDEGDVDARLRAIEHLGLDVREGRSRIAGEGLSIYFHDDDNHLFELHTGTLEQRLAAYAAAGTG